MVTKGKETTEKRGVFMLKEKGEERSNAHSLNRTNFYKNVLALLLYAPMHLLLNEEKRWEGSTKT